MVWINLLPWRERWLQRQRRRWLVSLGLLPLLLVSALLGARLADWHSQLRLQQLSAWQQASALLLQVSGQKMRWQKLLSDRHSALSAQQRHYLRGLRWRQLVAALPEHLPDSLWLTKLHSDGEQLSIQGLCYQVSEAHQLSNWLAEQAKFSAVAFSRIARTASGELAFTLQARWPLEDRYE